jgi:hypothetical protein
MRGHPISSEQLPVGRSGVPPRYWIRAFHRVQERIRHPEHREHLARFIALGRPAAPGNETDADRVLRRDGVTHFPGYLDPEHATALRALLETFECQDPWKPERGVFRIEDAPPNTHVADIPAAPTLRALHDIAFDPTLLRMAASYFGCRPYVDSIQAWWSLSGNSEPEEAENFHRDNDSVRFLKFFLYLTQVGDDDGPHRFVLASHLEPRALDRRRLTDDEVEEAFGTDRILKMRGNPGDAFMEDTWGVHKGQLPKVGRRLLVQIRYSIMPSVFSSRTLVDCQPPIKAGEADSLIHLRRRRG